MPQLDDQRTETAPSAFLCPGVEAHSSIDCGTHLFHVEVVPSERDFVHRPRLITRMADNLCNSICIQGSLLFGRWLWAAAGFSWFCVTNQINSGFDLIRQLDSFSVSVDMHEENSRLLPEEVIVQGRNLKPVFKQGRHYRIH